MNYIYIIQNKINLKVYIGLTKRPRSRWSGHKSAALRSKNPKLHNLHLSRAMRKYGIDNFIFTPIEEWALRDDANQAEKFWISFFNSRNPELGYNTLEGGEPFSDKKIKRVSSMKGKKHSELSKQLMSEAHMGEKNHFFGKTHSKKSRKEMSKNINRRKFGEDNYFHNNKFNGENHKMSKLTEDIVLEARNKNKIEGTSYEELAIIYNVSPSTISRAIRGITWGHLK